MAVMAIGYGAWILTFALAGAICIGVLLSALRAERVARRNRPVYGPRHRRPAAAAASLHSRPPHSQSIHSP